MNQENAVLGHTSGQTALLTLKSHFKNAAIARSRHVNNDKLWPSDDE